METHSLTSSYSPARGVHLDRITWLLCGLLGVLLLAVYFPTLKWTLQVLLSSDDMAHGLFAPLLAAYIVWQKRAAILADPAAPNVWGVVIIVLAGIAGVIASLGTSSTLLRFAFMASLAGCIVLAGGFTALSRLRFPVLLLFFAFPIPQLLYAEMTAPLQSLATLLSKQVLEIVGFSVVREGNLLELPHYHLSIVEACSGIRSLLTLAFFCVLYAYFLEQKLWQRIMVVALSVPSALLLNVVRITATGVLGEWRPELTHGIYHEGLGWACLALAFALVLFFRWALHGGLGYVNRRLESSR
ncbi:MAG: eight transrane protein EpsH [Bryobacterales bacterium]|nr:eight transrane protein EpsH [Bryobacterales bacterium]